MAKNKKMNKFLTGAITASMVATAVVPAAAAADSTIAEVSKFTDMHKYAPETQKQVDALAAKGIINGTSATTFAPANNITRGQVVKLLGRFLVETGQSEVPADWNTKQRFNDIPVNFTDKDLVKNAAIVFDAGVFKGDNGDLNSAGYITRQNMALVLDRAAEAITGDSLQDLAAGKTDGVTDIANAKEESRGAIKALNALGISTVAEFKPVNNVQRVHFATFLYNTIGVLDIELEELTVASAVATDANTLEVTLSDDSKHTVTLDEALEENVATDVTFEIDGKEYSATVTWVVEEAVAPKVESVSAINPTTIQVTFNEDITEEQAKKDNFSLSKGELEAVKVEGKVATLSVKGLTYGDKTTVTVAEPAYTETVTIPEVSELFLLEVKADDDVIESNGASRTTITVTLRDRATGKIVDQDGVVQFQATNGGLGQTTSALVDGKASVQLTSEASATSITSIVTATISDGGEYKGLTAQKAVVFSPNPAEEDVVQFVSPVFAEAKAGDRFFVQFSDKISADNYKKALTPTQITNRDYGVEIDGEIARVKDVRNVTENTLEFILDTDHDTNIRIEKGANNTWAGAGASEGNYLRDNVTHTLVFPDNVGRVVLENTTGVNFILTDTSRPAVLGVNAIDQLEFKVRFTEAVDRSTAQDAANYLIDGREIARVTTTPTAAQIAEAKANNQVILTSLQAGAYYFDRDDKAHDERNIVTFKVHKDFALADGVHQIQVANVGDYAQDVDPRQNIVATDTFDFNVTADKSVPVPTIEVQSPEQWKVSFDKDVYGATGKTIKDVFSLKSADENDTFEMDVDYIVSYINADGTVGTKLNPADNANTLDGNKHFLIEFTQDWTEKYDTAANSLETYFASTKNPYTVTVQNLESAIGNKMAKQDLDVKLTYDGVSPEIANAEQIKDRTGQLTPNVRVKMTEPVKNVDGNNEGLTPSQDQTANAIGVPQPTYEFVKGDKVVKATASDGSYDNYSFTLSPESELDAGEWTLYIRSISDDIGNTSATVSHKVTIVAAEAEATATRMAWAAFDDAEGKNDSKLLHGTTHDDKDVIYVKFTKEMKSGGANGVSRTQNYVFQGQPLPHGSQVLKGIAGVTNDWDGVTIVMPKGTWDGTGTNNDDFTTALNIASNFESADGEALSGAYEVELTDTATTTATLADGFEASYADAGTQAKPNQVTFSGLAQVIGAAADDTNNDGKIDEIELDLDAKHGAISAGIEVLVNGKTFVTGAANANAGSVTLTPKHATNDLIDGTDADNLKITGKDGSIIINTGVVADNAAPVITKAELNAGKDKITLTFSEAVTNNATDGTFEKVLAAGFNVGGTVATAVEHDAATPNKVVLTISNGAALTSASTIDTTATKVNDFAGNAWSASFSPIKGAIAATGITGVSAETTPGVDPSPGVAEVNKLTVTAAAASGGNITVAYGDGVLGFNSNVTVAGGDSPSTVAAKIADKLNTDNPGMTVLTITNSGADVIFTYADEEADKTVTISSTDNNATGVTTTSAEVTAGEAPDAGTAAVNTLTISGPATAAGNIKVTFDDGTVNESQTIAVAKDATAAEVAEDIKDAFAGLTDYTVTAAGDDVVFTADNPGAKTVTITVTTVE